MKASPKNLKPEALLEPVIALAEAAGAAIMKVYAEAFEAEQKGDGSPVTAADLAANQVIVEGLAQLTPGWPVISEETEAAPLAERMYWPHHWLVDPLDGTREFIKRNGEFTVNIALIDQGKAVLGVVVAPALKLTYAGLNGLGAWRVQNGARTRLASRPLPSEPVYLISRSHHEFALDALLLQVGPHRRASVGSSLKFCRIAEGEADCYPKLGSICEWDTAAGQCVLESAGGAVLTLPEFSPLRYGCHEQFRLPQFFAVGDAAASWRALWDRAKA